MSHNSKGITNQQIADALAKTNGHIRQAASLLGIDSGGLSRRLKRLERRKAELLGDTVGQAPKERELPLAERERVRYTDEISRLRKELKDAYRHSLSTEQLRAEIFGLAQASPTPPDWQADLVTAKGGPGVPQCLWSDWHWGEHVFAEQVGGVNSFNVDVAHTRARRLVSTVIDLCFEHQRNPVYPGIVVSLGGDMITGEIHQELAETNDMPVAPALIDLLGVLIWCFDRLLERFPKVFVPCVVGNHGRMTLKPRAKNVVYTSFEWLLFCMLERHYAGDDRIRFYVPTETDAHFKVAGMRQMLTHGDRLGVKGGDGFIGAIGPIMRGRGKVGLSEAQIGRDFDLLMMAHWHYYMPHHEAGVLVNGSLKGYDEYARLALRVPFQRPIQAMWFTHPVVGVTNVMPIYLESRPITRDASDFVAVWQP